MTHKTLHNSQTFPRPSGMSKQPDDARVSETGTSKADWPSNHSGTSAKDTGRDNNNESSDAAAMPEITAIKEDLAKIKDDLNQLASVLLAQGRDKASEVTASATDCVREHPKAALAGAFGAGIVLSMVLLRK